MQPPYGYGPPAPQYGYSPQQPAPAQAPAPQPGPYTNPFTGLPSATPGTDRRSAPPDGWYVLEIEKCLYFLTDPKSKMQGAPAFIADFKVAESLSPNGSPPGFPTSFFCSMAPRRKEQADRELQGFTLAVLGSTIEECGQHLPGITLAASDARNIFLGLRVAANVTSEADRTGKIDPDTGRVKIYHRWKFYPQEVKPGVTRGLDLAFQRLQANPNPIALPPKASPPPQQPAYGQAPVGQGQFQPGPSPYGGPPPAGPPPWAQPQQPAAQPPQYAYAQSGPQAPLPAGPPAGPPPWAQPQQPAAQPAAPPGNPFNGGPMQPPPGYRWDAATGRYVQG